MVRLKTRSVLPVLEGLLQLTMLVAGLAALLTLIGAVAGDALEEFPGHDANAGLGWRLAWWLVGPAASIFVVAGATVLSNIIPTAKAGDPFVVANVRRLRLLGVLTLGYFVVTVARSFVAVAIQDHLGVEQVGTAIEFAPIVFAVVLFALAEIWQRGVDMRDEQQLTV
jgi:hypothetical protein